MITLSAKAAAEYKCCYPAQESDTAFSDSTALVITVTAIATFLIICCEIFHVPTVRANVSVIEIVIII
jgi:hypothetical protein